MTEDSPADQRVGGLAPGAPRGRRQHRAAALPGQAGDPLAEPVGQRRPHVEAAGRATGQQRDARPRHMRQTLAPGQPRLAQQQRRQPVRHAQRWRSVAGAGSGWSCCGITSRSMSAPRGPACMHCTSGLENRLLSHSATAAARRPGRQDQRRAPPPRRRRRRWVPDDAPGPGLHVAIMAGRRQPQQRAAPRQRRRDAPSSSTTAECAGTARPSRSAMPIAGPETPAQRIVQHPDRLGAGADPGSDH